MDMKLSHHLSFIQYKGCVHSEKVTDNCILIKCYSCQGCEYLLMFADNLLRMERILSLRLDRGLSCQRVQEFSLQNKSSPFCNHALKCILRIRPLKPSNCKKTQKFSSNKGKTHILTLLIWCRFLRQCFSVELFPSLFAWQDAYLPSQPQTIFILIYSTIRVPSQNCSFGLATFSGWSYHCMSVFPVCRLSFLN